MPNRAQLLADLTRDEGLRGSVYDDATGEPVVKGYTLKGKATLAIGWCPETNPCPPDLAAYILGYFVDRSNAELALAAPWLCDQPEPVQRALCNMAYQLGVSGLLAFTTFIPLIRAGKYAEAVDDLHDTLWWTQSGYRAQRICNLISQATVAA